MNVFEHPDIIINIFLKMPITELNKVATLNKLIYKVFKDETLWKHIYDNNYSIFKNNYYETFMLTNWM